MKCPHCGSEWNIAASVTVTVQKCPFCGKDLAPKAAENATLESVLRTIRETYGADQLKNGKVMLSYFRDIAPKLKKEQRMLENFVSADGPAILFPAADKSEGERQTARNKVMFRLTEELLMAESHAKTVCAAYFAAICGETQVYRSSDFEITPDGVLTAYRGKDIHIRIPTGVKRIGEGVFENNDHIQSVELPEGLLSIGPKAFASAWHMKKITFPTSLVKIEDSAFWCSGLEQAVLPTGLKQIGKEAFMQCNELRKVTLPTTLTVVGKMAFSGCGLETVTIPGSLETVADGMFMVCDKLRQVTLQPGVRRVDNSAFALCASLEQLYIPASVEWIQSLAFMRVEPDPIRAVLTEPDKDPGKKRFSNVQCIRFR